MKIILLIIVVVFVMFLIYGAVLNYFPKVEEYEVASDKVRGDFCLVLLTDLHEFEHGRNNEKLLKMVAECKPDVVCIAGDLITRNGRYTDRMLDFLERISSSYEVFYAPGNHEIRMEDYEDYVKRVRRMSVHYLENESFRWKNGVTFQGLSLPMDWYWKLVKKRTMTAADVDTYLERDRTDRGFQILLAHNPEYFPAYAEWGADLTLSGHVHGGIMRLPFVGGVIAPSLQLFPKYDAGEFVLGEKKMIISRGLGLHHIRLRFFNRPEVSCIRLKAAENCRAKD